jgi:hypothetical protein
MKWSSSWLMVLCVVGMGAFFLLPALGFSLSGLLGVGLILLCPLSHLLMMRGMHSGGQSCHQGSANVGAGVAGNEGAAVGGGVPKTLPSGQPVPALAAGESELARVERNEG